MYLKCKPLFLSILLLASVGPGSVFAKDCDATGDDRVDFDDLIALNNEGNTSDFRQCLALLQKKVLTADCDVNNDSGVDSEDLSRLNSAGFTTATVECNQNLFLD